MLPGTVQLNRVECFRLRELFLSPLSSRSPSRSVSSCSSSRSHSRSLHSSAPPPPLCRLNQYSFLPSPFLRSVSSLQPISSTVCLLSPPLCFTRLDCLNFELLCSFNRIALNFELISNQIELVRIIPNQIRTSLVGLKSISISN